MVAAVAAWTAPIYGASTAAVLVRTIVAVILAIIALCGAVGIYSLVRAPYEQRNALRALEASRGQIRGALVLRRVEAIYAIPDPQRSLVPPGTGAMLNLWVVFANVSDMTIEYRMVEFAQEVEEASRVLDPNQSTTVRVEPGGESPWRMHDGVLVHGDPPHIVAIVRFVVEYSPVGGTTTMRHEQVVRVEIARSLGSATFDNVQWVYLQNNLQAQAAT